MVTQEEVETLLTQKIEEVKREILLSIPTIVVKHIQDQYKYKKLVDDFYAENPAFKKDKLLISNLMTKIAADNPDFEVEEVFSKTVDKAKKVLGAQT